MTRRSQGHLHFGLDNRLNGRFQIRFENVGFGQLFVPMGRQPDSGQRPPLGEDEMCVEHFAAVIGSLAMRTRYAQSLCAIAMRSR